MWHRVAQILNNPSTSLPHENRNITFHNLKVLAYLIFRQSGTYLRNTIANTDLFILRLVEK